jgi:spore cortex formation protein SpoVR/YcgB (stage V sporulation)
MMSDIRRICENPTAEDRQWFPDIAGANWIETLDFAMRHFKDESFIQQYLSPRLIREMKLFSVMDDDKKLKLEITAIHDDDGYQSIRSKLANQYNLSTQEPNIQVYNVNRHGDRSITLRHYRQNRKPLNKSTQEMLKHVSRLWGFTVYLEIMDEQDQLEATHECIVEH